MFNFLMKVSFFLLVISQTAHSKEVKLAVGLALPPYVISESNTGIELDIVKEALAKKGHTISIKYYPAIRVSKAMESKESNAALTVNESSGIKDVHYSTSHIRYQNVAIGLKENKFTVEDIPSLEKYSVLAFQNAKNYLGPQFVKMAENNKKYKEKAKQNIQTRMLYSGRVNIIVLDQNIFKYYKIKETKADVNQPIDVFSIFPPTDYKVAFHDKSLKDDFNDGLADLKSSGRYQEIIDSYIK